MYMIESYVGMAVIRYWEQKILSAISCLALTYFVLIRCRTRPIDENLGYYNVRKHHQLLPLL